MVNEKEVIPRSENDTAWKEILRLHLKDFVEFFWDEAFRDIDWKKPHELLEQELMTLGIKDKEGIGKRFVDKLFKVFLKNGQEQWILLHVEIQHSNDESFSNRMFTYFYRIFDRYNKDIASMAVLADKDKCWRPNQFHRRIWKSEITRTYEVVKLIDYKSREAELLKSDNPFAMAVLLQLAAMNTRPDDKQRLATKLEYFRCLHKHGWNIEKSMNLYRFLDTILTLNQKFELEYIEKAKQIDQEFNMKLMSTIERYGYQQGEVHGYQQGEAHLLINQLKVKFNEIPEDYIDKINGADASTLERWGTNFVFANSLDEVFKK